MAYTTPTKETFKARFSEFASLGDDLIDILLSEADLFADQRWSDADRTVGVLHLAAHAAQQALLAQAAFGTSGSHTTTDDDTFLFVKSVRFADREVTFDRRRAAASSSSGGGSSMHSPYSDTSYGQMYLRLRSRNIGGPIVLIGGDI
jgi:hypothetical protein